MNRTRVWCQDASSTVNARPPSYIWSDYTGQDLQEHKGNLYTYKKVVEKYIHIFTPRKYI